VVLPNLLPRAQCRLLIDIFESSPTIDGAVARIDAAGNVRSVVDHQKKHRRDLMIDTKSELHAMLRHTLLDRCAPEIARAFQARVSYTDRILLSRYDDTGGWFRRHRDNAASNTAFREFALSLNLNTGEYGGGHLIFPEYNDHRYSPPAGGGLIFSTGVLHEATPITSGRRYVLLTFFHSEAAEARRLAGATPGF
jgi:predicted 2-oxoglutarate/Fe(II)-dependent dioxygenase YbiX